MKELLQPIPGYHGSGCPFNGQNPEYECQCDECDHYLVCFPDWREQTKIYTKNH